MSKMNKKQKNFFIGSGTPAYRIQISGVNSIERGSFQSFKNVPDANACCGQFQTFQSFNRFAPFKARQFARLKYLSPI
jgi:hypothetical protein